MEDINNGYLQVMNLVHYIESPYLKNVCFLAINVSNSTSNKKQFNDRLFHKNKTGEWSIHKAPFAGGIEGRAVVLFYSQRGLPSTLYIGKIKNVNKTAVTKHRPPRDRYTIEAEKSWKKIGQTEQSFSRFFSGARVSSNPTVLWIDGEDRVNSTEHSNSFCDAWIGDKWKRMQVAVARMHPSLIVRCIECKGKIVLMQSGPNNIPRAHAEHRPGHEGCSLCHYFDGQRRPHPNPVQDPKISKRDPFADAIVFEDDESGFPEGKERYRIHKSKERDRSIVWRAKAKRYKKASKLECEVCGTDFHQLYGDLGHGFIEAHHKIPVSRLNGTTRTNIEDLAMVCSNCHRMLHRDGLMAVEELRDLFEQLAQRRESN